MKLNRYFIIFITFISFNVSYAEEASNSNERWGVALSYSPWDLWLPGKMGVLGSWGTEFKTYELAYVKAAYTLDFIIDDMGGVSDQRIHLSRRSHTWENSFNFQYGVFYNSIEAHLGKKYYGVVGAQYDFIGISTVGAMWGFGNKWIWSEDFTLGIDWFKIFMPLKVVAKNTDFLDVVTDKDDRQDVEDLVDAISKIPTFSIFHIEVGYRF